MKPKITPLARRLLLKTIKSIVAKPESFNQGTSGDCTLECGLAPSCKTPMCILGWMHHHRMMEVRGPSKRAAIAETYANAVNEWGNPDMGISVGLNSDLAEKLFYIEHWPDEFRSDDDRFIKARVAARRIRHFLETGE